MFVWVQVLKSRPIINERIWEGKEKFLPQGRRKEAFDVVETSLSRDGIYWLKGGLNGSSSVKYIFGTMHVMGITTLVTVLACKGLLISPLADFYCFVARVY